MTALPSSPSFLNATGTKWIWSFRVFRGSGGVWAILADRIGEVVERYENEWEPHPAGSAIDVLRFLMEQHGLRQSDLPEIGTQSVVSEILSGKRGLNTRQIVALAGRFGLPAGVFLGDRG